MNMNMLGALGIAVHVLGMFLNVSKLRSRPGAAKLIAIAGSFLVVAFFSGGMGGGGGMMGGGGYGGGGGGYGGTDMSGGTDPSNW